MRETGAVGRIAARRDRGEQRGVEPAAVLVGALEIEVSGCAQPGAPLEHRGVAHAGVEPDVEDVALLAERRAAAAAAEARRQQLGDRPREPCVGTLALDDRRHVVGDLRRQMGLAAVLAEDGDDRHAPQPLARDTPVGPGRDHAADALAAPGRHPLHAVDRLERALPQAGVLHRYEPLLGAAEEKRLLATPAVRVTVADRRLGDERTGSLEDLDDAPVGVEHALAREFGHLPGEASAAVHRRVDVEPVAEPDQVVVLPMARGRVDDAGTALERHMVAEYDRHVAVDPGVAESLPLEPLRVDLQARRAGFLAPPGRGKERLGESLGDDDGLAAVEAQPHVGQFGVEREREVRGQRPGRRRPGDEGQASRRGSAADECVAQGSRTTGQRKADVDAARLLVLVLYLGLRERGLAGGAPVDRLLAPVERAGGGDPAEFADLLRLVARRERQVGVGPVAEHAEPAHLVALEPDELPREGVAATTHLDRVHRGLLVATDLLLDLKFDRQPVTVPTRHVGRAMADQVLVLDDDVLQYPVQHMA